MAQYKDDKWVCECGASAWEMPVAGFVYVDIDADGGGFSVDDDDFYNVVCDNCDPHCSECGTGFVPFALQNLQQGRPLPKYGTRAQDYGRANADMCAQWPAGLPVLLRGEEMTVVRAGVCDPWPCRYVHLVADYDGRAVLVAEDTAVALVELKPKYPQ